MKALVYHGPSKRAWEEKPKPTVQAPTDAIVKVTTTTICGTDLHILKGDVPEVTDGRILGHEGVGIIDQVGAAVGSFRAGDRVLISCISSCSRCGNCRKGMYSHCENDGGWILGHLIDGTQAEYVRIPFADTSLYKIPERGDEEALTMLSDIFPTGFECGVLNGRVKPGDLLAVVGAGPIGLAVLATAQLYSPAGTIMIDVDDHRLDASRRFGATKVINSRDGRAVETLMALTNGKGVDVAIEAVGIPATFDLCQKIVAAGGHLANIGVHGRPVSFSIEKLWAHNITLTTRLVDTETIPMLMKMVESGKLQPKQFITHRFPLSDVMKAYDTFGSAAKENALKVILSA